MANLEVGFGADLSGLLSGIDKAEKELKKLEKQEALTLKAGLDTTDISKKVSDAKKNLDSLKSSMNSVGNSFGNAQKPIANAGNTLTNFSRIAQDAPFGIMGIGNNLTATAEAFAGLSKQAGGAGGALKALGASLMGGGGVLLAISLVTTALTVMSQKGITVGDVFDKLTGRFDEFKKGLNEIDKEAVKSGNEQAASAKAYVSAAQNINLSMEDRLIAVKKLQDEFPGYFGNLTKEQILNGNVSGAVKELTNALIARAKAQAFAEKIGALEGDKVALREQEAVLIDKFNSALAERNRLEQLYGDVTKTSTDRERQKLFAARGAVVRLREELAAVQDPLRANIAETQKWTDEINKTTAASIKLDFKPEKIKKAQKQLHTQLTSLQPMALGLKSLITIDSGIFKSGIDTRFMFDKMISDFKSKGKLVTDAAFQFSMKLKDIVQSGLSNGLAGIGEAIGGALATGGNVLNAVGMSLLSSLGAILVELGKMAIATGVGILAVQTSLKSLNPYVAIAGGVALVALGSAVSSQTKSLGNSMSSSGGGRGSSSSVSAGNSVSSPTSSVSSFSGGSGFQNVVFEISGQSLVGVLSNTLGKNVKLGGTPAI